MTIRRNLCSKQFFWISTAPFWIRWATSDITSTRRLPPSLSRPSRGSKRAASSATAHGSSWTHGAKELEACYEYFREHFSRNTQERTRLYEGEIETLSALKARGLKLGVVTNKPQDATEGCIQKFFPEGLFDFVGGDTGSFPCKPDPSLAQYAALSLRVAPSECAFVGDGETDAMVARNAGMFGVSVLWGYRTQEELSRVGASRFVSSYEELFRVLTTF